jgi:HEAT repeat protein
MNRADHVDDLIQSLKSDSSAARWDAAARLVESARRSHPAALTALSDALGDEDPFVRWRAGRALCQAGGARCMGLLYAALDQGSPLRRAAAADALVAARRLDAVPLLRGVDSPDALVRQSVIEALARRRDRRLVPRLVALLDDISPNVRRAAASALAHLRGYHAIIPLTERLADESPLVRRSAAYALGALRARSAMSALMNVVSDPEPSVRHCAAWALGRIGNSVALPRLRALLDDPALGGAVATEAEQAILAIQCSGWRRLGCLVNRRPIRRSGDAV